MSEVRRPLAEALESELHRFERATARVWTIIGVILVLGSMAYAGAVAPLLGLSMTMLSASYLAWYLWLWWRLSKGPAGRALELIVVMAEIALPWIAAVLLVLVRGPAYAVGSWLPPMLFCGQIVSNAVQLKEWRALANGVGGAVVYIALYFLFLRDAFPDSLSEDLLYRPPTHLSRMASLLFAGGAGWLAARSLKNTIGRAEVVSRERDLFGKYRLLGKLGAGGMGTVHEAVYCPEGGFERRVAVKRIHPHLAEHPKFVEAFRQEAAVSARLLHPNVVQVMDFGRVDGRYFLSMEFVDGAPLSELAEAAREQERDVAPDVVGHVGREVLAGLDHAHRIATGNDGAPLKVVHRDMCPQNLLVSRVGHVKISDFGVARAADGSALSQTFVGHVSYVAPEQAGSDHPIDERADLFPLGVILWELLAGRTLFAKKAQAASIAAVLNAEVPDISELRPDIDPAWGPFLAKALAREPDDRFGSAREMAEALESIADAHGDGSRQLAGMFASGTRTAT